MPLRKCVSMSTHGSSTPMVVNGQATLGSPDVANLFAIETTNGWTNASCLEATGTQWVRIFVEWNYFCPNAPTAPHQAVTKGTGVSTLGTNPVKGSGQSSSSQALTQPWGFPDILGVANRASVALCYKEVAANIAAARAAGAHVILAMKFFPRWVSGSDPAANAEPIICNLNNVMPPDNALAFYTGSSTPPNGSSFEPTDYAFYFWLVNLINLYHPASPNRPAAAQGQYVDAIEICNEPNFYYPAGTTSFAAPAQGGGESLAQSTALMMATAQQANAQMNASFGATLSARGQSSQFASLRLLGPALADSDSPTISHPFGPTGPKLLGAVAFAEVLLDALAQFSFNFDDKLFGWSMHNYGDIEAIGWKYSLLLNRYFAGAQSGGAKKLAAVQEISDALAPAVTPHFFGGHGRQFRTMLAKAKWRGWGDGAGPTIFMTEGGCRINRMPGYNSHGGVDSSADPDANFTTGAVPAAFQRELQRVSIGGAAHTLSMRTRAYGLGVGMLTNFLFFDASRTTCFSTGLLDQYGPNQLPAQANVTLDTYARPAFDVWRRFGFPKPSQTARSRASALSGGASK
jgi:hypothetical protein